MNEKRFYIPVDLVNSNGKQMLAFLSDYVEEIYGAYRKGRNRYPHNWQLMQIGKYLECFDDRDRIYAMLGLTAPSTTGHHPLLQPDYRKPSSEVLRDATRYALLEYNDVCKIWKDVYYVSQEGLDREGSLSWVPSWRSQHPGALGQMFFDADASVDDFDVDEIHGLAWDDPRLLRIQDPNIFEISGFTFDHVAEISVSIDDYREDVPSMASWLKDTMAFLGRGHSDMEVAEVLTAGTNAESSRFETRDLEGFYAYQALLFDEQRYPPAYNRIPPDNFQERAAARFGAAYLQASPERRPFRSSSGCIGIGPKIMREGDLVSIFYRARTPFILRTHPDGLHRIIGMCFLKGAMQGEQMIEHQKKLSSGTSKDQAFKLV